MPRAPTVHVSLAPADAPDISARPAHRGDVHRTMTIHWHGDGDVSAADALVHAYRDVDTGQPVLELAMAKPGGAVALRSLVSLPTTQAGLDQLIAEITGVLYARRGEVLTDGVITERARALAAVLGDMLVLVEPQGGR